MQKDREKTQPAWKATNEKKLRDRSTALYCLSKALVCSKLGNLSNLIWINERKGNKHFQFFILFCQVGNGKYSNRFKIIFFRVILQFFFRESD